jgi:hypothetical protein
LPGCLPELTLVSARELGQAEREGRGNLIHKSLLLIDNFDVFAKSPICSLFVIPAKAGIQ